MAAPGGLQNFIGICKLACLAESHGEIQGQVGRKLAGTRGWK